MGYKDLLISRNVDTVALTSVNSSSGRSRIQRQRMLRRSGGSASPTRTWIGTPRASESPRSTPRVGFRLLFFSRSHTCPLVVPALSARSRSESPRCLRKKRIRSESIWLSVRLIVGWIYQSDSCREPEVMCMRSRITSVASIACLVPRLTQLMMWDFTACMRRACMRPHTDCPINSR